MNSAVLWDRYKKHLCRIDSVGLTLDISRMTFDDGYFAKMEPAIQKAFTAMDALEKGAIANPDENRMVGHYWLRAADLAPKPEITKEIKDTLKAMKTFAADVHSAKIKPPTAPQFSHLLSIGIGGSALGPEFVADALGHPLTDKMYIHFIDNTDPDGIARVLASLEGELAETLTIVCTKSGGTHETRNGMLVVAEAYKAAGVGVCPARGGDHHAGVEDG